MSELKVNRITDTSGNEVLKSDSGTWTISASFTQNFTDSILTNPTLSGTMTGGTISSETTGTHSGPSTGLHSGQVTGSITGSIASSADFQYANIKPAFSALDNSASNGPTSGMAVTKSDSLPLFGCRSWVRFDGSDYVTVGAENHCNIQASGNISKVVRLQAGQYEIHFNSYMPDTNYAVLSLCQYQNNTGQLIAEGPSDVNTNKFTIATKTNGNGLGTYDADFVSVAVFR